MTIIFSVLALLLAAAPLVTERFIPTHDGEYHIIRFWQYWQTVTGGTLIPRWAANLNHGYGLPLFTFQYPLPNMVAALFHGMGFGFVRTFPLVELSGYLVALFSCYAWLCTQFRRRVAALGTVAGAFVPYWFLDLYVRGSVGEVWALAWVFVALYAVRAGKGLLLTVAVALLILSHNIFAVIYVPVIMLYILAFRGNHLPYAVSGVIAAAWFWIPALYEQRFVTGLSAVRASDHVPELWQLVVPSWGTGFKGGATGTEMSYQIGVAPLLVFLSVSVSGMLRRERRKEFPFAVIGGATAIAFMLPWSVAFWDNVPQAGLIQYPWRLLSAFVIVTPFLAAYAAAQWKAGWMFTALAVLAGMPYARPVTYAPRPDSHYLANPEFTGSTSTPGNSFTTVWMAGRTLLPGRPFTLENGTVRLIEHRSASYVLRTDSKIRSVLTAPVTYYPGWTAIVGSERVPIRPDGNGLVSFDVSQGRHMVTLELRQTPVQRLALVVSLVGLSAAWAYRILKK